MATSTKRVSEYQRRLIERGGRVLTGIRLSPEAATELAKLEQAGESATAVINRKLRGGE